MISNNINGHQKCSVLILGGNMFNSAEHVLTLAMIDYYGQGNVAVCSNPLEVGTFFVDQAVVFFFSSENEKMISDVFALYEVSSVNVQKILAVSDEFALVVDHGDLGQDAILLFSNGFQGDELTIKLRQLIGASDSEVQASEEGDHTVITKKPLMLGPIDTALGSVGARIPIVTQCLTAADLKAFDDHFSPEGRVSARYGRPMAVRMMSEKKAISFVPHLEQCSDCTRELENIKSVRQAGIRMIIGQFKIDAEMLCALPHSGMEFQIKPTSLKDVSTIKEEIYAAAQ